MQESSKIADDKLFSRKRDNCNSLSSHFPKLFIKVVSGYNVSLSGWGGGDLGSDPRVAMLQELDVVDRDVELDVRGEDRDADGAGPGLGGVQQPVDPVYRGLSCQAHLEDIIELSLASVKGLWSLKHGPLYIKLQFIGAMGCVR